MLYLSREQILSFFTMRDAIEADKKAFVLHTRGKAQVPLRINLETEDKSGQCMFMPAYVGGLNMAGVKMVSFFPSNAEKGIPVVHEACVGCGVCEMICPTEPASIEIIPGEGWRA